MLAVREKAAATEASPKAAAPMSRSRRRPIRSPSVPMPVIPKYRLEVEGAPTTSVDVNARDGKVDKFKFAVKNGRLIVRGRGLRPRLWIEGLALEDPKGLTEMKLHGIGIWRPIIAVFGGIARAAVRKLPLNTDIPSVMILLPLNA